MICGTDDDLVVGQCIHMELVPSPSPTPTPIPHPFLATVGDPSRKAANAEVEPMKDAAGELSDDRPLHVNGIIVTNVGTITKNSSALPHIPLPPGTGWAPVPKAPKPKIGILETPPPPDSPAQPAGDALMDKGSSGVNFGNGAVVRMGDTCASCSDPARQVSTYIAIPKGPIVLVGG